MSQSDHIEIKSYENAGGGRTYYYHNNNYRVIHRLDGPAVTYIENNILGIDDSEWWYHGTMTPCKSQEEFEKYIKLKAFW